MSNIGGLTPAMMVVYGIGVAGGLGFLLYDIVRWGTRKINKIDGQRINPSLIRSVDGHHYIVWKRGDHYEVYARTSKTIFGHNWEPLTSTILGWVQCGPIKFASYDEAVEGFTRYVRETASGHAYPNVTEANAVVVDTIPTRPFRARLMQ